MSIPISIYYYHYLPHPYTYLHYHYHLTNNTQLFPHDLLHTFSTMMSDVGSMWCQASQRTCRFYFWSNTWSHRIVGWPGDVPQTRRRVWQDTASEIEPVYLFLFIYFFHIRTSSYTFLSSSPWLINVCLSSLGDFVTCLGIPFRK